MSRRSKVRITSREESEIRKLNASVSSKKSRIKKNFGVMVDIDTIPLKDLKNLSRTQVNAYKDKLQSFTNRHNLNYQYVKNKEGVVLTKREANQLERQIERINRIKKREYDKVKKKDFTDRGKKQGKVNEQRLMGDTRFDRFKPLNFNLNRFRSLKEFLDYKSDLKESFKGNFIKKKDELYRQNYLQALENVFGSLSHSLQDVIKDLDIKAFMDKYYTENFADIKYIYDLQEAEKKLQILRQKVWT